MIDNSVNFVHHRGSDAKGRRAVDIELVPIQRRPAKELQVTFVRPLEDADIVLANQPGRSSLPTTGTVQRLRESHHALARIIAMGEEPQAAAAITGFAVGTIYRLLKDPTFMGLVEFYRRNLDLGAVDMQQRLSSLNADVVQELHDRVLEEPEKLTPQFLLKAAEVLSDRTGHSPVNRAVNINYNVGMADRLKEARQRALSASGLQPSQSDEAA